MDRNYFFYLYFFWFFLYWNKRFLTTKHSRNNNLCVPVPLISNLPEYTIKFFEHLQIVSVLPITLCTSIRNLQVLIYWNKYNSLINPHSSDHFSLFCWCVAVSGPTREKSGKLTIKKCICKSSNKITLNSFVFVYCLLQWEQIYILSWFNFCWWDCSWLIVVKLFWHTPHRIFF